MKKIIFISVFFFSLNSILQAQFRFTANNNEIWEVKLLPSFTNEKSQTYCVFAADTLIIYNVYYRSGVKVSCSRDIYDLSKNILGKSANVRHKNEVFVTLSTKNTSTIYFTAEEKKIADDFKVEDILGDDKLYTMPKKYYQKVFSEHLYIHLPKEKQKEMKKIVKYQNLPSSKINFDKK